MIKLSVVIITFNEEKNIGRCIDSVSTIADEIVVLDSYSTDKTTDIVVTKGAKLFQQKFAGYIEQKNHALDLASNEFVFCLDADESIDKQLEQSILSVKKNFNKSGYEMNRCTSYCGRFIRHGSWYPDRKLRLFKKSEGRWGGDNPHDRIELKDENDLSHIKGDILHFSYNSIAEHAAQNNKFSSISADALYQKGKRTTLWKIIFNPWWSFVTSYIIRLGFLDRFYGFVIAVNIAHLTFLKHVKLYQKQKSGRQ